MLVVCDLAVYVFFMKMIPPSVMEHITMIVL